MSVNFEIKAELRHDVGKGASRRLRRTGKVPAVIYGAHKDTQSLTFSHHELIHELGNEAFYSSILTVNIDGRRERAILRDLQRHPYKPAVLHMDLQRIRDDEAIRLNVPLHFMNEESCRGVKEEGGVLNRNLIDVQITCMPKDLPEYLEVDVVGLAIGDSIHLSELTLPEGVKLVDLDHEDEADINDSLIISVHAPHVEAEPQDEDGDDDAAAASDGEGTDGDDQ